MNKKNIFAKLAIVLLVTLVGLVGCGQSDTPAADNTSATAAESPVQVATEGTLYLRVNPEIAIKYNDKGLVTGVKGDNDDGKKLVESFADYTGKETREVINEIVTAIGEAGYFVEEVEGKQRKITIEVERGSVMPNEEFIAEIVSDIRDLVTTQAWNVETDVTDYGVSDYATDYDNHTDYTDYDDTDYGTNADSSSQTSTPPPATTPVNNATTTTNQNTDDGTDYDSPYDSPYDDTDYDDTDYDDSDYGAPAAPATPPVQTAPPVQNSQSDYSDYTDYDDTDYEDSDYDDSDYSDYSDYDDSDYGDSDYD